MAVTLINPFEIAHEQENSFLESWRHTADVFAGKPGYLDTLLHRSIDPSARFRFVNIAHWASAEAWETAMKASPPEERELRGVRANPALYVPLQDSTDEEASVSIDRVIRTMEERLAAAYQGNDVTVLQEVLADDILVTDGPGTTSDKRKILDDHATKRLAVSRFRFDEMTVRRLGTEAALVTGQYTWEASYSGYPIAGSFRYVRVYVRTGANWRVKAGQVTPISRPVLPTAQDTGP